MSESNQLVRSPIGLKNPCAFRAASIAIAFAMLKKILTTASEQPYRAKLASPEYVRDLLSE